MHLISHSELLMFIIPCACVYFSDMALSEERLLNGVKELIQSGSYRSIFLYDRSLALSIPPSFSCMDGYKQLPQSTGCGTLASVLLGCLNDRLACVQ